MHMSSRLAGGSLVVALALVVALGPGASPASADPPAAGALKINEIESQPASGVVDFVELINTGPAAEIGGYVVKDNDNSHVFTVPAGTTIAANGYYVADVDNGSATAFGLGSADSARLFAPADLVTPIDSYTWATHAGNSYGRCPNGSGSFVNTASVTRGAANDCPVPNVKINEIESQPASGVVDFVELINNGATTADIGGYVVKDNDNTHVFTVPAGTMIATGAYYVADVDNGSATAFGLGSADSARLFAPADLVTPIDSYTWTSHAGNTYGRCPNGTGSFVNTTSVTRGAANDCGPPVVDVKINEIESQPASGVVDFVELINNGAAAVNIGGYVVKDNDDTHVFTVPAGTTIVPGGYYVADVDNGSATAFGLGSADSARLFAPGDLVTAVDTFTWTSHATTTYGRCPNGSGAFTTTAVVTRGATNICPGDPFPWPGGSGVATADGLNAFGSDMSGLAYQASGTTARGVLWAVRNGTGTLFRLVYDGTKWTPDTTNGWSAGKQLRYPDGTGVPDAEGVSLVNNDPANGIYVATERNGAASGTSRPSVLRFDVSASATTLVATHEWNLAADLPAGLGNNLGPEAVQWMSDAFLVSKGFKDEVTNAAYDPASYPNHGSGLFFVGVEQNGTIYAYALNHSTGAFTRVATIASGFATVMELEFEPESGHLWAVCDDTCVGRTTTLDIAQSGANAGKFVVTNTYDRPTGMANLNNEGFAITPQLECVSGLKPVFWTDDGNTDMHALRAGTLNCTPPAAQTITFAQPAAMTLGDPPLALVATSTSGLQVSFAASGPCSIAGTSASPTLNATGAGACDVTASQAGNMGVLPAADVVRSVTINKTPQTITFAQPAPTPFGSSPVALVATSTSTLPVGFTASGPCSISGTSAAPTLTASGAGVCVVTASQPGNETFAPATDVQRLVTITKSPTRLTQRAVSVLGSILRFQVRYEATLTSRVGGGPVAGQTIAFSTSNSSTGPAACSGVTNSSGVAACTSPLLRIAIILFAGSTTASYGGSPNYEPSTITTPFRLL